jgi:hypothetical protein
MTYGLAVSPRYKIVTLDAGDTVVDLGSPDPFPVIAAADVVVRRTRAGATSVLVLDADYAVSLLDQLPGARVTLAAPALLDDVLEVIGARPIARTTDLNDGQRFSEANLNAEFDTLTLQAQEARRDIDRSVTSPLGEAGLELPEYEAGKALTWDLEQRRLINSSASPAAIDAAIAATEALRDETSDLKDDVIDLKADVVGLKSDTQDIRDAAAVDAAATITTTHGDVVLTGADVVTVAAAKAIVLGAGGVPFETTAAGIAATVNGQMFEVKGVTNGGTVYKSLYKNVAGVATAQDLDIISKAGFDAVFDLSAEWVAYGGLLGWAFVDSAGKIYGAYRQDDGIFRSRLAIASPAGAITYSFDTATGYTNLAVVGLEASDAEMIVEGYVAQLPLVDVNNRVWGYGRSDGSYYFPHLAAGRIDGAAGGAVDATAYYFAVEDVAGVQQIIRYAKSSGIRVQMTTLGANTAPHVSADGSKIIYTSSRTTPPSEFFQPVGGGLEVPLVSSATLVPWGNSLSTINYWVAQADRTTISQGVGGQNDDHVAARMDAVALTCNVAGDQIPAAGSVAVDTFLPNIWFHWNFTTGAFRATITGTGGEVIPGTLTYNTGTLAFVRDVAGVAVNVPHPATVHITSGKVEGSTDASTAPSLYSLLDMTSLLYPNYNSISQGLAAGYTLADIFAREVADFARIQPLLKRFVIIGDYMGQARLTAARAPGIGTAGTDAQSKVLLDATIALNAMRKAQWPDNFYDLHAALVAGGHSSQFTFLATTYDIIDDTTLVDGTHPTTPGAVIIWGLFKTFLTFLGF